MFICLLGYVTASARLTGGVLEAPTWRPVRRQIAELILDATDDETCHANLSAAIIASRAEPVGEPLAVQRIDLAAALCLSPPLNAQLNRERAGADGSRFARLLETLVLSLLTFRAPETTMMLHLFLDERAVRNRRIVRLIERVVDSRGFAISVQRVDSDEVTRVLLPAERGLRHGLHECAYLSALAPRLFNQSIPKLIWLDIDVVFLDSAAHLWSKFAAFDDAMLVGMAMEQTPYYITERVSWPAIGNVGVNTGVQLLKLEAMRAEAFTPAKWFHHIEKILADGACSPGQRGQTCLGLADQDVWNAMLEQEPARLFQLNCRWNTQLIALQSRRRDMAQPCLAHIPNTQAGALTISALHGNGGSFFAAASRENADYGGGTHFASVQAVYDSLLDDAALWSALLA